MKYGQGKLVAEVLAALYLAYVKGAPDTTVRIIVSDVRYERPDLSPVYNALKDLCDRGLAERLNNGRYRVTRRGLVSYVGTLADDAKRSELSPTQKMPTISQMVQQLPLANSDIPAPATAIRSNYRPGPRRELAKILGPAVAIADDAVNRLVSSAPSLHEKKALQKLFDGERTT